MWDYDETSHYVIFARLSKYLVRAPADPEADYDPCGRSYGNSLNFMRKVSAFLKTLCSDRD